MDVGLFSLFHLSFSLPLFFFCFFYVAHCSGVKTAGLCGILTGETDGGEIEYYDVHIGIC